MKSRRLDVMLSSTSKDLPDHRKQAEDAAARAGFYVVKMENLPALPQGEDAISVSLAMVEEAEVYIGIFGMRYGYRPTDDRNPDDLSITEMEYRRAKELGMPILVFIMDEDHPGPDTSGLSARTAKKITDAFYERDAEGEKKLEKFKEDLQNNHIVDFFTSAEDLRSQVLQALNTSKLKQAAAEYAAKREGEAPPDTLVKRSTPRTTIPEPPNLYAYPPYSGQNARFVGRRDELRLLDEWAKPAGLHPMLVLEAIGGMGKSALTWRWVQDRAVDFDGIFWYSFYEGGALMNEFIVHALAYVTQRDPTDLVNMSFTQVLGELIHTLRGGRFLLVLDGLERVLVAYHHWNAAQMQDDQIEEGRDYRGCTDPRDNDVLRQLAGCDPSRILVTSRLMPIALSDAGGYLPGVQNIALQGLSPRDARELWHMGGVSWQDEGRLDNFVNQFGRHSLLLKLLVDIIKKNRRANGSFDHWFQYYGDSFNPFQDIQTKRHHILAFAYEGLESTARKLLSQMAAVGNAMGIDTLNMFNPYLNPPEPATQSTTKRQIDESFASGPFEAFDFAFDDFDDDEDPFADGNKSSERKQALEAQRKAQAEYEQSPAFKQAIHRFDALLQDLEERGLIWWDAGNLQYDLHPVVRGYAFAHLGEEDRPATFDTIYNYFEEQERRNYGASFTNFKEMQNLIAMYNALIGANKLNLAAALFMRRISEHLIFGRLGMYHKAYELMLPFFPDGLGEMPTPDTRAYRYSVLSQMATVLEWSERWDETLPMRAAYLKASFNVRSYAKTKAIVNALLDYGGSLQGTNQIVQALRCNQYALTLCETLNTPEEILHVDYCLLCLYVDLDRWEAAHYYYERATKRPLYDVYLMDAHRQYAIALTKQGADLWEVQAVLNKAEALNRQHDVIVEERMLSAAYGWLAMREGEYDAAINFFAEAAAIGNEQGVRDSDSWSGLAQAHAAKGNLTEALLIIGDGVNDHGHAAAVVHLANNDPDSAREPALEFYNWAWAQGEPYVRRWELEQARELLRKIGEREPQLPVWDESQYVPFEHEDLVIEYIEKLKHKKKR